MGGFVWVLLLSALVIAKGWVGKGIPGVVIFVSALASVIAFSPWRNPRTPYWRLMLAPYGNFLLAIVWAVWAVGGYGELGMSAWSLAWLLPTLIPFATVGNKRWEDGARPGPGPRR